MVQEGLHVRELPSPEVEVPGPCGALEIQGLLVKNWWLSWYAGAQSFILYWPWWVSGTCEDHSNRRLIGRRAICAAVRAESAAAAKAIIGRAHDPVPDAIDWRFCNEKPDDWIPFNPRFPKADWMRWPVSGDPA
jgi:hypothetical protein